MFQVIPKFLPRRFKAVEFDDSLHVADRRNEDALERLGPTNQTRRVPSASIELRSLGRLGQGRYTRPGFRNIADLLADT
jgi:hypothetical protein